MALANDSKSREVAAMVRRLKDSSAAEVVKGPRTATAKGDNDDNGNGNGGECTRGASETRNGEPIIGDDVTQSPAANGMGNGDGDDEVGERNGDGDGDVQMNE